MTDTSSTSARRSAGRKGASSGNNGSIDKPARQGKQPARRSRRLRRWLIWYPLALIAMIALIPVLLTLVYRIDGVRPVSTLMLDRVISGEPVERRWVTLGDVSPRLYQAVMMSEDGQFCAHHGVDWAALNLVISEALDGERPRGASTITMQVAKNLFLWSDRSYLRKALEVPLALWIDLVLPKKRVMEIYLNVAEWGPDGQFGATAAAEFHFGRTPDNLTNRQASLLAVTLPNPHVRDPARPTEGLNRLARLNERRAAQSGAYIGCLTP